MHNIHVSTITHRRKKKVKKMKKLLSILLSGILTLSAMTAAVPAGAEPAASDTIAAAIQNPGYEARPMCRFWFPDAGAGLPGSDYKSMVSDLITQMADAGFGGVEITMLADSNNYDTTTAESIGWGTPAWAEVLSTAVYAANQTKNGFRVDVTITAHWPPIINTIDPNDDQQQQELTSSYQKLTASDLANGVELNLPSMKTEDFSNTNSLIATFLFQEKLVGTTLAKVAEVKDGAPVLDYDSMTDIPASIVEGKGYAVGIPEEGVDALILDNGEWRAAAEDEYLKLTANAAVWKTNNAVVEGAEIVKTGDMPWNQKTVVTLNGEDITSQVTVYTTGAVVIATSDADNTYYTTDGIALVKNSAGFGDRERMADWQDIYAVDADTLASALGDAALNDSEELQAGDYVLVNTYRHGTGQICSGGQTLTMANRTYAVDYFNEDGIAEVTNYWNQYLLPHVSPDCGGKSLAELMEENGGSIFEDSIEIHHSGSIWTAKMLEDFEAYMGYDIADYLPILSGYSTNASDASRHTEDYNLVLGHLYNTKHAEVLNDWTSTFGYSYRAQAYTLTGVDVAGAAIAVDIPEGDNSTSGDGIRNLAAANNVAGKQFLSMEALTSASDHPVWFEALREINANLSDGINRIILHGIPFTKSWTGVNNDWPGWTFMSYGCWAPRQPFWQDIDTITNYFGRAQTLLQLGSTKVPVAVLNDQTKAYQCLSGSTFQRLLDNGYTYDILSEAVLDHPNATAENGILCPNGASYQALILNKISKISCDTMDKILGYADAGVKIIVFNSNPNQVYGTSRGDNTDEAVAAKFSELLTKDNVYVVDEDDILTARTELLEILQATVTPSASYDCQGLEVTSLVDDSDGTNYYFFFNEKDLNYEEAGESSSGGFNPGMGSDYSKKDFSALTTAVTLKGTGTPYLIDPMTGEITPVAEYTVLEDGRVQFDLSMEALNTMIVAVTENTTDFPAPVAQVKEATGEGELVYVDGETLYRSETSGDSAVISYADGSWKTAAVGEVPAKIELGGDTLWNLDIESWGPDAEVNEYDPSLSKKVNITAGETALKLWKELTISEEELAKTGASSAEVLSGIGTYTKTITLPDTWTDDMGATLTFEHKGMVKSGGNPWGGGSTTETLQNNDDEITRITVTNAKGTFEVNDVNPLNDFVDLTTFLDAGENTISIQLTTSLENREDNRAAANYGLTDAALVPYVQVSPEIPIYEVQADESAEVNTPFTVKVTTNASITDVLLFNENDLSIGRRSVEVTDNGDGTKTFTVTAALGTVGNGREIKIVPEVAEGYLVDSGKRVVIDITSVPASIAQLDLPDTAVANRTFIVRATTDMAAAKIVVYNEFGTKMGIQSLSYEVVDGQKVWTGVMSIGTKGDRTFTAYAVNKYGVLSQDGACDSVTVTPFAVR